MPRVSPQIRPSLQRLLSCPGPQAQHLLIKCCLGLPGTSCGARWINSRSWRSSTGFMRLAGWVVSPGWGLLGLSRHSLGEKRGKEGKVKALWLAFHGVLQLGRAWQKSQHLPNMPTLGPGSVFKATPLLGIQSQSHSLFPPPKFDLVMSLIHLGVVHVLSWHFYIFPVFVVFTPRGLNFQMLP